MRIPGLKKARLWARWLTSRLTGGALILGYHRIADVESDHQRICVSPENFDQQLQVLGRYTRVISLDNLTEALRIDDIPSGSVVITFDDGYADNFYQAQPLLEQYVMPATLFIATGYLGRRFWWDELNHLILESEQLDGEIVLDLAGVQQRWTAKTNKGYPTSKMEDRRILFQTIYQFCLELANEDQEAALDQLRKQLTGDCDFTSQDDRALTADELQRLANSPLVTIGAHTVTHPLLTRLPVERQREEIGQSKDDLESILGQPVTAFSYPNGAANGAIRALVDQSGFDSACASVNDVVHPASDPFHLPRFWIPDWDGDTFARWLRKWLPGGAR